MLFIGTRFSNLYTAVHTPSVGGWSGVVLQDVAGCCRVLQGVGMGVFADVTDFVYHICANAYMYYVHMRTYTCMVYMNV